MNYELTKKNGTLEIRLEKDENENFIFKISGLCINKEFIFNKQDNNTAPPPKNDEVITPPSAPKKTPKKTETQHHETTQVMRSGTDAWRVLAFERLRRRLHR